MRIVELWAENIKGFESFRCECSDVNVAAGQNGTNKTSFLTLVTAVIGNLGGKGNTRILRAGAEHGEIGMRIASDDGTETWDVCREVEPGKLKTPTISSSISGKVGSPVAWLQPLVDKISIEPISRAMNAPEAEQVEILLSTIPMSVDQADLLAAASGVDVPGLAAHLKNAPRMPSGLDAIAAIHKAIYDHRTNVNRDAKLKRDHAAELLAGIPKSAGSGEEATDWRLKAEEIDAAWKHQCELEAADRGTCEQERRNAREGIDQIFREARESAISEQSRSVTEVDSDIDARIRELEKERAMRKDHLAIVARQCMDKIAADHQRDIDILAKAHQTNLDDVAAKYRPEVERLTAEYAVAKRNAEDQIGHDNTRAIAAERSRESAILKDKSDAMTAALDRLDRLKVSMLQKLDAEIPGLSVEGGAISLGGVALSEKNTAEQVKFWLKIGARRTGELGVTCVDGMECLDAIQFDKVVKGLLNSGTQWFLGRVDEKEFRIERIAA